MNPTLTLILSAIVLIVLFLIVRFFWLWYWRVNTVVNELRAIRGQLELNNRWLASVDQHLADALSAPAEPQQQGELP